VRALFEAAGLVIRSQTTPVPFYTFSIREKAQCPAAGIGAAV
jgi:hypothetical protein